MPAAAEVFAVAKAALAYDCAELAVAYAELAYEPAVLLALSLAKGIPPAVDPSWTTIVFLSVSTVSSAITPVKVDVCAVLPLRIWTCVDIVVFIVFRNQLNKILDH